MHENKSSNRNPANHRLFHALMEALIEDENAMDKRVADTGKNTKRRRTKESESSKKPSTTKETPKGKAPSKGSKTGKSAFAKEPVEEPIAEMVMDDTGEDVVRNDDQPQDTSEPKTAKTPNLEWFKQPPRPTTPDLEWNKRQVVLGQPEQPWFNQMVSAINDPLTFNDLMSTHIDFSKYVMNRLNDLEYLKSSDLERTYTTSITKTKASRYEIVGIEDMVLTLWSTIKHAYDKDAILGVKSVSVNKLHGYGHLEEVVVKRAYRQLYKFKEGNFVDLHLNDIEDMLILAVQHKIFHLNDDDIVNFIVALHMFTRSLVIKRRVENLQLGVESYQKKLNIPAPQQTFLAIEFKELYTPSYKPPGVIYEDLAKQKRVMRADELYKFSDKTLKKVRDEIHHKILNFRLRYNDEMSRRKWMAIDKKRSELMVEMIDKQMRERRIIKNLK
ncbi:hypothetical protein Tco_1372110 [Tanacetum coccineum]